MRASRKFTIRITTNQIQAVRDGIVGGRLPVCPAERFGDEFPARALVRNIGLMLATSWLIIERRTTSSSNGGSRRWDRVRRCRTRNVQRATLVMRLHIDLRVIRGI